MKSKKVWKETVSFVTEMIDIYVGKRVSRSAAELSYFLTLSVFPLLLVLHAMIVQFMPGLSLTLDEFEGLIPSSAINVISEYLGYVRLQSNNSAALTAGIIGMCTTSAAAFRSLHNIMADIQGQSRFHGVFKLLFSFLFSLLFLLVIYFAILVMVTGNWLMNILTNAVPLFSTVAVWQLLKYPVLFLMLSFMIWGLYRLTAPKELKKSMFVGALIASVILVVVSVVFSEFISLSSRYPLVYGTLASIIIFMLWIYICGNILIMGNALNLVLRKRRESQKALPSVEELKNEDPGGE